MKRTQKTTGPAVHPDLPVVAMLFLFIVMLVAFLLSFFGVTYGQPKTTACTMEARLCSDGSSVSRTGPSCEFAPCPNNGLPNHPGIIEEPQEATPQPASKKKVAPDTKPPTEMLEFGE